MSLGALVKSIVEEPNFFVVDEDIPEFDDDYITIPKDCKKGYKKQLAFQDFDTNQVRYRESLLSQLTLWERAVFRVHEALVKLRHKPGVSTLPIRNFLGLSLLETIKSSHVRSCQELNRLGRANPKSIPEIYSLFRVSTLFIQGSGLPFVNSHELWTAWCERPSRMLRLSDQRMIGTQLVEILESIFGVRFGPRAKRNLIISITNAETMYEMVLALLDSNVEGWIYPTSDLLLSVEEFSVKHPESKR
jgi:hypothetical protein